MVDVIVSGASNIGIIASISGCLLLLFRLIRSSAWFDCVSHDVVEIVMTG